MCAAVRVRDDHAHVCVCSCVPAGASGDIRLLFFTNDRSGLSGRQSRVEVFLFTVGPLCF